MRSSLRGSSRVVAGVCALAVSGLGHARADEPPAPVPSVPAAIGTHAAAEDLPLRFRDMLAFEAARARPDRLFSGIVNSISGLGLIGAGVISLATAAPSDPNAGVVRSYGYVMLSIGGTALLASLIDPDPPPKASILVTPLIAPMNNGFVGGLAGAF